MFPICLIPIAHFPKLNKCVLACYKVYCLPGWCNSTLSA